LLKPLIFKGFFIFYPYFCFFTPIFLPLFSQF